jgi:hypothetical protein
MYDLLALKTSSTGNAYHSGKWRVNGVSFKMAGYFICHILGKAKKYSLLQLADAYCKREGGG